MFDHVTIRVSDLDASRRFYDLALSTLGHGDPATDGHFFEWGDFSISVARPERPLTKNLHIGFAADSRDEVEEWWRTMTDVGFESDGEPGARPVYTPQYFGAFVLDPDGNSVEAVHHEYIRTSRGSVDHLWIRVDDVGASKAFYETIAPVAGFEVRASVPDRVSLRGEKGSCSFLTGERPTEHVHMAFRARDNATVDEFHRLALAAGYSDNGRPGERGYHPGYYGAFVLDPDGNNVEVVCHNR